MNRFADRVLSRGNIVRIAVALSVAIAGIWIGRETLGAYVARSNLRLAGSFAGSNAAILGLRARADLEAGNIPAARQLALLALERDPTVLPAIQTLGLSTAAANPRQSAVLLGYAQHLSRRNLQTHLWAIEYSVARGDIAGALDSYDRALRTSVAARDILFPVLSNAAGDPVIARRLAVRLGRKPLWYDAFLWFVGSTPQVAPATALRLFALATRAGAPIQPAALSALVSRSFDTQQYDMAWDAYSLLRPGSDRRRPRDPGFERLPDIATVFDWTLATDGSILAQSNGADLEIEAGSGATGIAVQQRQVLPPGRYQLLVANSSVSVGGSLTWSLICQSGPELARLATTAQSKGHFITTSFVVSHDCPAQNLLLTVDASESPAGLHAVINDVAIRPVR